jgi:hypothetical protein
MRSGPRGLNHIPVYIYMYGIESSLFEYGIESSSLTRWNRVSSVCGVYLSSGNECERENVRRR